MAKVTMEAEPWDVPDMIRVPGKSLGEEIYIPVQEAAPETVKAMAREWLGALYAQCGIAPDWRFE